MSPDGERRPAVFLDRDGTLIHDRHYLSDPAGVELLPGAAEAVARLSRAGFYVVLVTNQSGIGRGFFGEDEYRAVHGRLVEALARHGARLDADYHCSLVPDAPDPEGMRKPGAGMFLRAAREHGLELAASWFVGDRARDVTPARALGSRAVLVRGPQTETGEGAADPSIPVVESLSAAVDVILAGGAGED